MAARADGSERPAVGELRVWLALLGGPAAWAMHVLVSYALVPVSCELESKLPLLVATAAALGAGATATVAARRAWGRLADGPGGRSRDRLRTLAFAGTLVGALALLTIGFNAVAIVGASQC